jgi:cell division protein FtsB
MRTGPGGTNIEEANVAARNVRKRWLVFLAVLAILIAVSSVIGKKSLVKVIQMNNTKTELEEEVAQLRAVNERLAKEIRTFADNPGQVEAIAREDLGLVKPGEIVYRFGRPKPSASLPTSSR